jgi:hypothetical protein
VIGGADGLATRRCATAPTFALSFGAMVWPHMLVRVMLAEQLYRAATILAGALSPGLISGIQATGPVVLASLTAGASGAMNQNPSSSASSTAPARNAPRWPMCQLQPALGTCPHATLITTAPTSACPPGRWAIPRSGTPTSARAAWWRWTWRDRPGGRGWQLSRNPRSCWTSSRAARAAGGTAHLMGVVSDGGVHGHLSPREAAAGDHRAGVPVALHAITDGRDVAPVLGAGVHGAAGGKHLPAGAQHRHRDRPLLGDGPRQPLGAGRRAYEAMVRGKGEPRPTALAAWRTAYARGETDEFIAPTVIGGYAARATATGSSA